jgi:hypothetical protein
MADQTFLSVHALLLAERLDTRALERRGPVLPGALSLGELPGGGRAFAFRWGAVVTIGATLQHIGGRVMRAANMVIFAQAIALPLRAMALRLPTITP